MTQIKQNASSNVNKILIGNKCDVDPSERVRLIYPALLAGFVDSPVRRRYSLVDA